MILQKGRPTDLAGRAEREIRVYDLLDRLGIEYESMDHPAVTTMEGCRMVDERLHALICKNLFLCDRRREHYFLLMLPGEKKFRTAEVSALAGSGRLSFASQEDMDRMLDLTPGAVSVMGLMNDQEKKVQLLIDEEICEEEYFGCHPCVNTTSLRFRVADLLERVLPAIGHEPVRVRLSH